MKFRRHGQCALDRALLVSGTSNGTTSAQHQHGTVQGVHVQYHVKHRSAKV